MTTLINRRRILRGTIGGAAVSVGLPFLDCFLNSKGTALAATGQALPSIFGTWYQALGYNPGRWVPKTVGAKYENNAELEVFNGLKHKMNVFSGMKAYLDGRPLQTHFCGIQIMVTGGFPLGNRASPSIDSLVADRIGSRTRFRSLEMSLDGSSNSVSRRSGSSSNASEPSPLKLYSRIFGPEFKDPNAAEFAPDPVAMARKSMLSVIAEERQAVVRQLGASDKARLDEYFTALRELEQQLDLETQKPAPIEGCTVPGKAAETTASTIVDDGTKNNKLFTGLLAHALACGQTRVFNFFMGSNGLRQAGSPMTWHMYTHEEPVDPALGYQKETMRFINWGNQQFLTLLNAMEGVKEGDGTMLDRSIVFWTTDHGYARTHTLDNIPMMTAGSGGGRIKTGLHVVAAGDSVTRVGLTLQQAMGVPVSTWGELSNQTSKTITEIMA